MQNYMLALKGGFDGWSGRSEEDRTRVMGEFMKWVSVLQKEDRYVDCTRPVGENRRVSARDGELRVDGPFPETKEVISGIFMIRASDIEDAARVASACPVIASGGSVEVFSLTEDRHE